MYEMIARALGYGGNEEALETLARRLPLHVLTACVRADVRSFPAALRFAAGRDAQSQIPRLRSAFRAHRVRMPLLPERAWRFSRVRSANSIDRRLEQLANAAVSLLHPPWWPRFEAALLEWPVSGVGALEAQFPFLANDPGGGAAANRLREMLLNVAAPFMLAEGRRRGRRDLVSAAARLYHTISPASGNRKTQELSRFFALPSPWDGTTQQGLIELHDSLCLLDRCASCCIGNALFGQTLALRSK
jgi:hypothetical protein